MQSSLQVTFENIEHSDAVEARIRDEASKLEQFHDRITAMRVVVGRPHRRHNKGNVCQIKIHMTVPGGADIAISREPAVDGAHEDAYVTIRDAFAAARRQLQDRVDRRQDGPRHR